MNKHLTLLIVLLCAAQSIFAQSSGWQYLPNVGLATPGRFEDVYFTDTNNGYAVYIEDYGGIDNMQKPIYKTNNGGITWSLVGPSVTGSSSLRSIEFLNDKMTGIVGSLSGTVYRSSDAGYNWTDITSAITDTLYADSLPAGTKKICGIAHYGNTFYCVGWWGAQVAHVYKSTDAGVTWATSYIDTSLATSLVDAVFYSADSGFITGGKNLPGGAFWGASSDESVVLRTTNGGLSWTKVFSDTTIGGRIWKIQMIDRMTLVGSIEPYYYRDTVNIIKSTDGGNTWTIIHIGRSLDSLYPGGYNQEQGVGFASKNTGWVGGYFHSIYQTKDAGATWDTVQFGANFNRVFVLDSTHVFAGGESVYKWVPLPDTASHVAVHEIVKPPHTLYRVSPNPASGMVKIEFDLGRATNVVLQVANVDMRKHTPIANARLAAGHYTYYWDGTNMPAGNYVVWLGTDEVPLTQKFVLVR